MNEAENSCDITNMYTNMPIDKTIKYRHKQTQKKIRALIILNKLETV